MAYDPPPILWKPAATNHRTLGRTRPIRAIVNHRMVGTLAGTTAHFQNPEVRPVSTHFGIGEINGKLQIHQYVALDDTAYGNGNYDPSGNWDDWGYPTTEINAQTISIEHQDHWGDADRKGIVPANVRAASMWLQALLLRGSAAELDRFGVRIRDADNRFPVIRDLRDIPVDGQHIINHNDIAGRLKPYCWQPWAKDEQGFPRAGYVTGIRARMAHLNAIIPDEAPPAPPPTPPTEPTYTQAQLDAAVAAAVAASNAALNAANTEITRLKALAADIRTKVTAEVNRLT